MEMQVPIEELRKRKLFVAAPMYGGMCAGMFTKSMCDLTALCTHYGIELRSFFLFNESLITRARNYCVDEFLRSGFDNLMFIDADIGFDPNDVIALFALQTKESMYDVIAGPYPKKCITWEKIKMAVDKGMADEDPNNLENFVGDFVFNPIIDSGVTEIKISEPAQVGEAGTGFMMIRRETFEKYDKVYPELLYKPDHVRTEHFDGSREIMAYFDCIIDPESKRYLSEDYMFCYNVRKMGGTVWLCPWMRMTHVGTYLFNGSLAALASIGASATADETFANKQKKKSIVNAR
jgi:glycosyltransferase involved in cell wall biosynthesis